ncbi:hypothetical protein D3C73_988390 [compost metagenome]
MKFWSELNYLGVPILNFIRKSALEGLAREAEAVDFTPQLQQLRLPVTLFVGRNQEAAIPSDISEAYLEQYNRSLCSLQVVEFAHSGHMIPDEEQEKYIAEITRWLHSFSDQEVSIQ